MQRSFGEIIWDSWRSRMENMAEIIFHYGHYETRNFDQLPHFAKTAIASR